MGYPGIISQHSGPVSWTKLDMCQGNRPCMSVVSCFSNLIGWPFLLTNTDGQCRRVVRAGLITTVTATSIVHGTERKATWRGHQANRVGIFSKADMDRLLDLTGRKPFWIGLNDSESRGRWEWVSGEPVTYTNWRKSLARGKSTRRCVLVSRRANRQIRDCKTGRGHRYVKT
ncbi:FRAS1-related extracellular matrix protein 1-like [Salvelinus sp. IW2-2015]|uniref:FRAS1-related extracellular matrix protein 1-like n=1 Tax=Salvelinus sp. IW2-2015 TaxID=2691554 RepID=UPI000CDF59D0|nr:FRAS1-related extracellular matrix protein 1-like [Salvelinus alpinus]